MANHHRNLDCGHSFSTNQMFGLVAKDVDQMSRLDPSVIVFLIRPDGLWVLDEDDRMITKTVLLLKRRKAETP